jgi:hypothetical protein
MTCGGKYVSCYHPRWVNGKNTSITISVITRLPRSTIRRLDERTFLSEIPELGVQLIYQLGPGGVEVAR